MQTPQLIAKQYRAPCKGELNVCWNRETSMTIVELHLMATYLTKTNWLCYEK